jgi:hypothetical protein
MVMQNQEDAEKKMQGTTRIKKRKGKSSNFKQRPNRTKNAKRRAFSSSKSDKIDSGHNLDEASINADDEAEDVEMEGEDADGKV